MEQHSTVTSSARKSSGTDSELSAAQRSFSALVAELLIERWIQLNEKHRGRGSEEDSRSDAAGQPESDNAWEDIHLPSKSRRSTEP